MNDSIICFTLGLSRQDIQKGILSFYAVNQQETRLTVAPVTEDLLGSTVGEVVTRKAEALRNNENSEQSDGFDESGLLSGDYRAMIINADDQQQVLQVMRSFKKVLPDPQNMIFAMVTPTAWDWTFQNYFEHLTQEHEYMKTHSPENDPDMKRM